ncbi:protein tweety homolog 1 isoform X6 [Choloepus didactylus]|uniref:protein tweety homolog 1 isoform X6 n=1 Tax=Choloepus didactylus TaxID=27675 RepID=UPI00189EA7A1|nr:protein tweety homolog 1 isoform X6 [Choloepus didactylus]
MGTPPGYRPSAWVHLLHQLPRADFQLRPVPSGFAPREQDYQQALLLVVALAGLGLGLSLIGIAVYLIRFCCCRPPEPPGPKSPQPGAGCVTWSCVAALLVGCAGIGIGFYGNSETSDGVSQLGSALLHANHTLSAIDHLVSETVERLGEAVRTELTTLEEVLAQRTELVAAARGARRQAEAVAQQLQGLAFWQGVPLSPLQVAEDVSFVEEYRWLAYVLLLLLELLVCFFTLLGLAKQSKWLVMVMTVMSLLVLVLSWGSMGLEAAAAVGLSDFCSNPDAYVLNLTQEETGLSSEADSVPASSGHHPLAAAGPGERSSSAVPRRAEAPVVLGGDAERDGGKLPPAGGAAALPRPPQGLRRGPARRVRGRPGGPALPAALLPAGRRGPGRRALQPAPRLGPVPAQESKRFVQWQSSI